LEYVMSAQLPSPIRRAIAAAGLTAALVGATALTASASTGTQQPGMAAQFAAKINAERAANNRAGLAVSSALTGAAERWASTMASRNTLAHNPNLAGEVSGWRYLGENVGVGYSVSSLESAFWSSAEHRSNILDAHYTRIGVAVVDVGGKLWVAEEFELPYGASTSTPHAASSDRSTTRTSRSDARTPLHPTAVRRAADPTHPNRCPLSM
jgi:uncharacterized protein YkwD